jgi:filamentous hemagglutinin family protein
MNRRLFRLVFSGLHRVLVPVWEGARRNRPSGAAAPVVLLACSLVGAAGQAFAVGENELPVPVRQLTDLATVAGAAHGAVAGNTLTIQQTVQRATIDWQSFNIGAKAAVVFDTPGASAITLNRIGQADPSVINGVLRSDGQVYLVNQNGVLFGNGARVDTAGLIASALDIRALALERGFASLVDGEAAFVWAGTPEQFAASVVRVEGGARISTTAGGRVMLLGPKVENAGRIEAPDGQVILAAGSKVYLSASTDPRLRGFLVEVDPLAFTDGSGAAQVQGGTVTNVGTAGAGGEISAPRGNVTLAGLTVNQGGRVSATTSVSANGSVYLVARDTTIAVPRVGNANVVDRFATRSGSLTLGAGSRVEVLPEAGSAETSIDAQTFQRSEVFLQGGKIRLDSGAGVVAPGAIVTVAALANPNIPTFNIAGAAGNDSRIFMDAGSFIDVSGTRGVSVSVSRNIVTAELRGNELRDSPLQREGVLRGEKIQYDVRSGTPIGDVSAYTAQIRRSASERTAAGGTIDLRSEGDVVIRQEARLDVSGGWLDYTAGTVQTTKLLTAEGQLLDISQATPERLYQKAFLGAAQVEAGYREGKDAGGVQINARAIALDGTLLGSAVAGPRQRAVADLPRPGSLVLGDPTGGGVPVNRDFRLATITVARGAGTLPDGFMLDPMNASLGDRAFQTRVSTQALETGGFGHLSLNANDAITVPVPLAFPSGGSFTASGRTLSLGANIVAPGGSITLSAVGTTVPGTSSVTVTPGTRLDVSGFWVNDLLDRQSGRPLASTAIDGGTISIVSAGGVSVGADARLDVSGSGWFDGSRVRYGKPGSIDLATNVGAISEFPGVLDLAGTLRGFGAEAGGTLALRVGSVFVGSGAPAGAFAVDPGFFTRGGFQHFTITAPGGVTVAAGTVVRPAVSSLVLARAEPAGFRTGTAAESVFSQIVLPDPLQPAASLGFSAPNLQSGNVLVDAGARVETGAGGSIRFSAGRQLTFLGAASAPAGKVELIIDSNPGDSLDPGFDPAQSLWVGSGATLSAVGSAQVRISEGALRTGQILDGGTISLTARRGIVVVETGARFDVSGTSGVLDLPVSGPRGQTLAASVIASNGGLVRVDAREGLFFDGSITARPGGATAAAGRLEIELDRNQATALEVPNAYPTTPLDLRVLAIGNVVPAGLRPGDVVAPADRAVGRVKAERIGTDRFSAVSLVSEGSISFEGNVDVGARARFVLDSPALSGNGAEVEVGAPYVSLGSRSPFLQSVPAGTDGSGSLTVAGRLLDVFGRVSLRGFDRVALDSQGDLRFNGVVNDSPVDASFRGELAAGRNLDLRAARVYATSLSDFRVNLLGGTASTLRIDGLPGAVTAPLSAGSVLTLRADRIVQSGVVFAPHGELRFEAAESVVFEAGSVTSVVGPTSPVPFGQVQNGRDWIYDLRKAVTRIVAAPPEKRVDIGAPDIRVDAGARFDLSGGGDLLAYEFVPGLGGSSDYLAAPGTYAILPSLADAFAPYDRQYATISDLLPGDRLDLGTGSGLPAGTYTLLPGHYGLLPGAYVVRRVEGTRDFTDAARYVFADGATVVAGRRVDAGGAVESRAWGYVVESSDLARTRAQYDLFQANAFFRGADPATTPRLPVDAGQLVLAASAALRFDGDVAFRPGTGGRGGLLDLDAQRVALRGGAAAPAPSGFLDLDVARLDAFGADSILIGGRRATQPDGRVRLQVGAREILVDSAGTALVAGEIVIAATEKVSLRAGTEIRARDGLAGVRQTSFVEGDGALVRVADATAFGVTRTNVTRSAGALDLGSAVRLVGGAVELDATSDTVVAGNAVLDATAVSLAASRITFGADAGPGGGLSVGEALETQLSGAQRLALRSYSSIDFAGNVTLGAVLPGGRASLAELTLDSPGLRALDAATVIVNAGIVRLGNSTAAVAGPVAAGTGTLTVVARDAGAGRLVLGSGPVSMAGFATTRLDSDGDIRASGTGTFNAAGDLVLAARVISGESGARLGVAATGALVTERASGVSPVLTAPGRDARIALTGATILHGGFIDAPAGTVALTAENGSLTLSPGSRLAATGVRESFDGVERFADAGRVVLTSRTGGVSIADGATIDLSSAQGAMAGRLSVQASQGTLSVGSAATLSGRGPSADAGGAFDADLSTLGDFGRLAERLDAGGFHRGFDLRLRTGGLDTTGSGTLRARNITIAADAQPLSIDSVLEASGPAGGNVQLWGGQGVILESGARLFARGTAGDGGTVVVSAGGGQLASSAGVVLDVSGTRGGEVLLRAVQTGNGADVAIDPLPLQVTGASEVVVEGVRVYSGVTQLVSGSASGANLGLDTVVGASTGFMQNAAAIAQRLDPTGALALRVRPGVEVRGAGNVTLAADWNLVSARFGGEPGHLTIRAAGNLLVNRTLSDGFTTAALAGQLAADQSWSYRLGAGADLAAANPLAVLPADGATSGDLIVANNAMLRTGTGDLAIAARRDIRLSTATSLIYTAGRNSGPLAGFPAVTGAVFPNGGGDLTLTAGRDIVGVPTTQIVSNWLYRQGTTRVGTGGQLEFTRNTAWWPRFDLFRDNTGALGGGDVTVIAGRDLHNLAVMLPTNARMPGSAPNADALVVQGGGDLRVETGGDILGGKFFVASGTARIAADGSLLLGDTAVPGQAALALHPLLFGADTRFDLSARGTVNLEAVLNPTVVSQVIGNAPSPSAKSFFITYSDDSLVTLRALTGDVNIHARRSTLRTWARSQLTSDANFLNGAGEEGMLQVAPPGLDVTAFGGGVKVLGRYSGLPAPRAAWSVLADRDIRISGSLTQSDADPGALARPEKPESIARFTNDRVNGPPTSATAHAPFLLHAGDPDPARLVSRSGDIVGGGLLSFVTGKPARVIAGRDIVDLDFVNQNVAATDVTRIEAGRDIVFSTTRAAGTNTLVANQARLETGGPGRLEVVAGRDVELGSSNGILTRGNLNNSALPDTGASLYVRAGAASTVDGVAFLAKFPGMNGGPESADFLRLMRELTGEASLDAAAARARFLLLSPGDQRAVATGVADQSFFRAYLQAEGQPGVVTSYRRQWTEFAARAGFDPDAPSGANIAEFVPQVLWPELRASGREAATRTYDASRGGPYQRGLDALSRSALGEEAGFRAPGDINMIFSQIKTERGGAIDILAPGGDVNVGLATPPAGFDKGPDRLGIITVKGGDVNAMVNGNFQVNQSRVFTLEGGNILIWSSEGNIDAGRGAKTAISAPPPVLTINAAGELVVEFPGAASGSGIGTLTTVPGVSPGEVSLIAVKGFVDAGDAGVRASGDLVVTAGAGVIGAGNFQSGGASIGVPTAPAAVVPVAGVASVAAEAAKSAEKTTEQAGSSAAQARARPQSFITVEVIGMGDDQEKQR